MSRKPSALLDENLPDADVVVGNSPAEPLDSRKASVGPGGIVAESWGILALPTRQVRELLSEEDGLLDR